MLSDLLKKQSERPETVSVDPTADPWVFDRSCEFFNQDRGPNKFVLAQVPARNPPWLRPQGAAMEEIWLETGVGDLVLGLACFVAQCLRVGLSLGLSLGLGVGCCSRID